MTSNQSKTLNSFEFPLHGARLIEASAGTGKTFTIATLYLRALLGHGKAEYRHQTPLTVEQILVVTFTDAATAELKGRIRARIHEARLAFARGQSDDPVLSELLQQTQEHKLASSILLNAERQMDEAAIYTIHGFCQRMLSLHAFESNAEFEQELVPDLSDLKWQVVCDYWRKSFYPLPIALTELVQSIWASPYSLYKDVAGYLDQESLVFEQVADPDFDLPSSYQSHIARIEEIKTLWHAESANIPSLIDKSGVDKRSYSKRFLPGWLTYMEAWCESADYEFDGSKVERFSQSMLVNKTKKGSPPTHKVFELIEEMLAKQPDFKSELKLRAIEACRNALRQDKKQAQKLSFNDLLSSLDQALISDQTGAFAQKIAQQYPIAMIDEFQDTDPAQYHIFRQIYLDRPESAWLMIGDPKQAIYAFRGADIFTYIKARNEVLDHYTLDTNWRSSDKMIQAVNGIFKSCDNPFIYNQDIEFLPVSSSPNADLMSWQIKSQTQAAIQIWQPEDPLEYINMAQYRETMSELCASQVQHILTTSDQGLAGFIDKKSRTQPVLPSDIAILVRTGREASLMKEKLSSRGIASVYLSNRDSVFSSTVAQDVLRILYAVSEVENSRYMHAVLGCELFALSMQQIDALNQDEDAWEALLAEFRDYQNTWRKRGVLPMLRQVIAKRELANIWLSTVQGERVITDLLHLAEILQEASVELESEQSLIRWYSNQLNDASGEAAEQIQRLESERDLVQIVTIHKSKGLEYKMVMLPFICGFREADGTSYYDETREQKLVSLNKSETAKELAEKERLAEDLRLLYVALTRGVYACYLGIAPVLKKASSSAKVSALHLSALGAILQNHQEMSADELSDCLAKLITDLGQTHINYAPSLPEYDTPYQAKAAQAQRLEARQILRPIERNWRMTSYSGILKQAQLKSGEDQTSHKLLDLVDSLVDKSSSFDLDSREDAQVATLQADVLDEANGLNEMNDIAKEQTGLSIFDFPRGAQAGTFLHTLFEEIDFEQPNSEENRSIVLEQLRLAHYDEIWLDTLMTLIDNVLHAKLTPQGMQLAGKSSQSCLVEMEFLLPIEAMQAKPFNDLIQTYDPLSAKASEIDFHTVRGMLKGFIDLVFEHEGRYYVLDWKSNYLGDSPELYQGEALAEAMLGHRYDIQYQIYSLALHRFLRTRIPDYDYQTHFGGVYYIFLRGMSKASDTGIFFNKPEPALIDIFDQLISNTGA